MKRTMLAIMILLTAYSFSAISQNKPDKDTISDGVEFIEFVFDQTITKIGSDFFKLFYSEWENPSGIRGLSVYVGEKPMPGIGTQIWVKVENEFTFIGFVRPNLELLQQSVNRALQQTESYFLNYELIQSDLESEDFSGTGLF
ncbi:CsgE family curli-type amyloid fiber assembly protein [Alkaliflexus imshenetskii]|uniref:CsgE family curli-type amyloid fiber assembly protein n=1 Tax=Alkaliflexus imshenetskii TaxID=286730 RepID=UPI00047B066A|nr:CsgE family curli-type amyloid fiber assembly protein [Alkaliflexus imshenetskii]